MQERHFFIRNFFHRMIWTKINWKLLWVFICNFLVQRLSWLKRTSMLSHFLVYVFSFVYGMIYFHKLGKYWISQNEVLIFVFKNILSNIWNIFWNQVVCISSLKLMENSAKVPSDYSLSIFGAFFANYKGLLFLLPSLCLLVIQMQYSSAPGF